MVVFSVFIVVFLGFIVVVLVIGFSKVFLLLYGVFNSGSMVVI